MFSLQSSKKVLSVTLPFSLSACTQLAHKIVNNTTSAFPLIPPSQL